jgi:choice-of-anchor B domain-containing protein
MKQLIVLLGFFYAISVYGQNAPLNIDSLGKLDYNVLHNSMLNDIWGYVDEFGNEYGLVGGTKGTSVVDVTTPSSPVELFWETGIESVWRDLKTWGDYAYVTTEALNGLLIIDLSPLPSSTALTTAYYTGPVGSEWQSAHNLYVDENGFAYIFGANRGNGGVIILDLNTDPLNPVEVGVFDDWYVHDGQVQNDTMYLGHIGEGFMSIVDVTDKSNPVLLGTQSTPSTFTHNVWASNAGDFAFTTDEISGGYIGAFDISNPTNIVEVDRVQSSPGSGVIPHNTHVLNNFIITSYYSDGVVIHDITYPYNMIEVGSYDTYFAQTTSYDGCWGAYPFLPSGIILATDRSEGFFVLGPTYTQASYLEGIVTDAATTNPVDFVDVQITGSNQLENTNVSGFYATGMVNSGTYDVVYSKVGYYTQTIPVSISTGVITTQDVQLVAIPPFDLTVNVLEQGTAAPIIAAYVLLQTPFIDHPGISNGLGQEDFTLFYEDDYVVSAGKWGYVTSCSTMYIDSATGVLDIYLIPGYYDDFTFDFEWTTSGTATTGLWERGKPNGTSSGSAPDLDVPNDCGEFAFVTGNSSSTVPDDDDVDNGTSHLSSPVMDLSSYSDPYVNYSRWFYNYYGPIPPPDDKLIIMVSNGTTVVTIDQVASDTALFYQWIDKSIRLSDFITVTSTMQFFIQTSDLNPGVNITEAGFDKFFIADSSQLELSELANGISIYPNPTNGMLIIEGMKDRMDYKVIGMDGNAVIRGTLSDSDGEIDISQLSDGVYFINFGEYVYKVIKCN